MPFPRHFDLDPGTACLANPEGEEAARPTNRLYVCRLDRGHEGHHEYVPVEMVIYAHPPVTPLPRVA